MPHLIHTRQLGRAWIEDQLFTQCDALREGGEARSLAGKALYCLFYEPSFLTRTSFERAMTLLGGHTQFTEDASQFFPVRSTPYIDDTIRFLESLKFHAVVLRNSQPGVIEAAAQADVLPVINGGSDTDHPTQALLDLYTLKRELGGIDGVRIAVVGRVDHRNVNALLTALALFKDVQVMLVPFTGQANPGVLEAAQRQGLRVTFEESLLPFAGELDAIYLSGAETPAHARLMVDHGLVKVKVDEELLAAMRPDSIILDPMQRTEPLLAASCNGRWAGYRQAENGLYVRMAVLLQLLDETRPFAPAYTESTLDKR